MLEANDSENEEVSEAEGKGFSPRHMFEMQSEKYWRFVQNVITIN